MVRPLTGNSAIKVPTSILDAKAITQTHERAHENMTAQPKN
jgi:hypothetical protein